MNNYISLRILSAGLLILAQMAAEEEITTKDGRILVGNYNEEKGTLTIQVGAGVATMPLPAADIVSRKPVQKPVIADTPKPKPTIKRDRTPEERLKDAEAAVRACEEKIKDRRDAIESCERKLGQNLTPGEAERVNNILQLSRKQLTELQGDISPLRQELNAAKTSLAISTKANETKARINSIDGKEILERYRDLVDSTKKLEEQINEARVKMASIREDWTVRAILSINTDAAPVVFEPMAGETQEAAKKRIDNLTQYNTLMMDIKNFQTNYANGTSKERMTEIARRNLDMIQRHSDLHMAIKKQGVPPTIEQAVKASFEQK